MTEEGPTGASPDETGTDEAAADEPGASGRRRGGLAGMAGSARSGIAERIERTDRIELLAAIVLSLATISSAWAAYQATRWTGVQATEFSRAGALRSESVRSSNLGNVQASVDVSVFTAFLAAFQSGDERLTAFYRERFREEFKPAFEAWLASTPDGVVPPGTPFSRPEYRLAAWEEADRLEAEAAAAFDIARGANQTSDNFVLTAVLFASVLFFAGIGSKFQSPGIRRLMIVFAGVMFVGAVAVVFSLPQNIGI